MIELDLLPNIQDYLETLENEFSIKSDGLEPIIAKVCARTGLDKFIAKKLVIYFFTEIRNAMLRGDIVTIRNLGSFLILKSKNNFISTFEPGINFLKKINDS